MQSDVQPPTIEATTLAPQELDNVARSFKSEVRPDGTLIIDLRAVQTEVAECSEESADPLNPEIVVCSKKGESPQLDSTVGPPNDNFASAIPRARFRLSDTATLELNGVNASVGGFNANAAEIKLGIDF